jgi:GTP-binding protein YchF
MSFSVGIVGLPNVGKSTLFKALTKKQVDIAAYPFTTISPNVGVVAVPDERLEKIAEIIRPEKATPTIIEFVDIAGLVKGAHKGEGLGNQFLSHIRGCDAILEIVRDFKGEGIEHLTGEINPQKDIEIVNTELLMKDLETAENLFKKMEKDIKAGDKKLIAKEELLRKIQGNLSQGKLISELSLSTEEKEELKEFQFLTLKPIIYVLNVAENFKEGEGIKNLPPHLTMNLKVEEEISELSPEEREELGIKSRVNPHTEREQPPTNVIGGGQFNEVSSRYGVGVDQLILACYNILELITFYTVAGGKETRAWTLKKGQTILKAAGRVHSDFEEKFVRGEAVSWQDLISAGSWARAREKGQIKTVGRDYLVQDGDVIEFKI